MGHGQAGKQRPLRSTWCLLLCLSCATAGASSWMRGRLWRRCQLCCTGPEVALEVSLSRPPSQMGVSGFGAFPGRRRDKALDGSIILFEIQRWVSWSTWTSLDIRSIVPLLLSHSTKTWCFCTEEELAGLIFVPPPRTHTLLFLLLPATSHWILWIIA